MSYLGGELGLPLVLHAPGVGGQHLTDHGELAVVAAAHHPEVEEPVPGGDQGHLLHLVGPVRGLQHHGAPGQGVGRGPPLHLTVVVVVAVVEAARAVATGCHWPTPALPQHGH